MAIYILFGVTISVKCHFFLYSWYVYEEGDGHKILYSECCASHGTACVAPECDGDYVFYIFAPLEVRRQWVCSSSYPSQSYNVQIGTNARL